MTADATPTASTRPNPVSTQHVVTVLIEDVGQHRVAILDHGRIIACDTPAGLKAGVDADTVIDLTIRTDPTGLTTRLTSLPQVSSATADGDGRLRVLVTGGETSVAAVVQAAAAHELIGLTVDPVTLETIFLTLTGRQLRE